MIFAILPNYFYDLLHEHSLLADIVYHGSVRNNTSDSGNSQMKLHYIVDRFLKFSSSVCFSSLVYTFCKYQIYVHKQFYSVGQKAFYLLLWLWFSSTVIDDISATAIFSNIYWHESGLYFFSLVQGGCELPVLQWYVFRRSLHSLSFVIFIIYSFD